MVLVLQDATSRGIRLDLDLAEDVTPVQGERIHLQQVVLNLLLNGMDAVGGLPPARRHLRVRTGRRDGAVELTVQARGEGIAPDVLTHMFDAFYTTKGMGMGMGLSIARRIMDAHGGRMHAENNADGGATVGFSLPARA